MYHRCAGAPMLSAPFSCAVSQILFHLARECGLDQGAAAPAVVSAAALPFLHWSGSVMKNVELAATNGGLIPDSARKRKCSHRGTG